MNAAPGNPFEAVYESGTPGLVGTVALGLLDNQGNLVASLSPAAIIETPAGSGIYAATRTAPTIAGQYTLLWSLDGSTDPDKVATDELVVSSSAFVPSTPGGRDLCTLADVTRYAPAYVSEAETDATLQALITSESESIHTETGREIVAYGAQPASRSFPIDRDAAHARWLEIGDLASAGDTDITVELLGANDQVQATIARSKYRAIYFVKRQPKNAWEPVTALEFPRALGAPAFSCGQTILVTGNWGFPSIPSFIREACAKRVILRYVSDVAATGTRFAEALGEINFAGLFASARDSVELIDRKPFIG